MDDIELWTKIRVVLDMALLTIARYRGGERTAIDEFEVGVAEVFGSRIASEVRRVIDAGLDANKDTVEIIRDVRNVLVKHVLGEKV